MVASPQVKKPQLKQEGPKAPPPLGHYQIVSKRNVLDIRINYNGHVLTVRQFLEKACGLVEQKQTQIAQLKDKLLG